LTETREQKERRKKKKRGVEEDGDGKRRGMFVCVLTLSMLFEKTLGRVCNALLLKIISFIPVFK